MNALITGASSGIGKEIAVLLAKKGYDLIISARREDRLKIIKSELENLYNIKVVIMVCDLALSENVIKLHKDCLEYDVSVFVNNAGFGKIGFFDKIPFKEEVSMIDTNIKAVYILTKLFSQSMKSGYIMNVASIAGFLPQPKMAVYGGTKAFVLNMSQAVNYELKKQNKNLHICTLCPGPVDTEFNDVAKGSFKIKSMTAKKCAEIALKGMFAKKDVIIPGKSMKLMRFFSKITPLSVVLPIAYNIQDKKTR